MALSLLRGRDFRCHVSEFCWLSEHPLYFPITRSILGASIVVVTLALFAVGICGVFHIHIFLSHGEGAGYYRIL